MPIRIANGAGFLGDSLAAPRRLVESANVDVLTLEYLAELTMSILARAKEKDPRTGYAKDFLDVLRDLLPALAAQPQLKIVTNAGGVNPLACVQAASKLLVDAGLADLTIGVVTGDDLWPRLSALQNAGALRDADTQQQIASLPQNFVCANAYLGAQPIAEALSRGARMVITGRVADASLTVGPAMHALGGSWNDWNRLAAFSVAGHLIECGAQVTGGYSTDWAAYDLDNIGYPIAEIAEDGVTIITKPEGSGGTVNRRTVIEQLTYEIDNPRHYKTPDVDVDFTTVDVTEVACDRVQVRGATGRAAPPTYKVSAAYRTEQTMATGELLVYGSDAIAKAHMCTHILQRRLGERVQLHEELLGAGNAVPIATSFKSTAQEIVLRLTATGDAQAFARELASLITSGPAGLAGYASGRPSVRPIYRYQPLLVEKSLVPAAVDVRSAGKWATGGDL